MAKFHTYSLIIGLVTLAALIAHPGLAAEQVASPQVIWRLLDYVAVDYAGAVKDGEVISHSEYTEMQEFAAAASSRLADLPPAAGKGRLLQQARQLASAIDDKAQADEVADLAHTLADDLLTAYPVTMAPTTAPDMARAKMLFAENCASCHGLKGDGKGPDAEGLDPPPIDFTDRSRAAERSVFGLYQVISQGLEDTDMASFDWMPPADRWALAFYVGQFAFSDSERDVGQAIWESHPEIHDTFSGLEDVTKLSPASLTSSLDEDQAYQLAAFLRADPQVVLPTTSGRLDTARSRLEHLMETYAAGDHDAARDLALSAYLDGFEPVEPILSARDPALMRRVESAMLDLRSLVSRDAADVDVEAQVKHIRGLLDTAEAALSADEASIGTSFVGAFTILLREGLEALLIVVAMIAFLRKAERTDVLPHVHAGWVAALAGGVLTWAAATWLITIGGASREVTEGVGGLLAAVVLVSVGIWMHGKSQAGAWQQYIRDKMSRALTKRSAWLLFLLAFVVVYREAFETILFFIALWSQGNGVAILAGAGAAVAVLGVCAWVLLFYSRRLPIAQFFRYSSILMAVLAVVLAGKGVAALQESGWIDVNQVAWVPRVELAGLFPTMQGVIVQLMVLAVLLIAFWYNGRRGRYGRT